MRGTLLYSKFSTSRIGWAANRGSPLLSSSFQKSARNDLSLPPRNMSPNMSGNSLYINENTEWGSNIGKSTSSTFESASSDDLSRTIGTMPLTNLNNGSPTKVTSSRYMLRSYFPDDPSPARCFKDLDALSMLMP